MQVLAKCLARDSRHGHLSSLAASDEQCEALKQTLWAVGYAQLLRIFQYLTAVDHDWKVGR